MAIRKVSWSHSARDNRKAFFKYWNNRNKSITYSKKIRAELSSIQKTLKETPYIFRETDYEGVRIVSRKNFSLYYAIMDSGDILIVAFWGRQDPNKLTDTIKDRRRTWTTKEPTLLLPEHQRIIVIEPVTDSSELHYLLVIFLYFPQCR